MFAKSIKASLLLIAAIFWLSAAVAISPSSDSPSEFVLA